MASIKKEGLSKWRQKKQRRFKMTSKNKGFSTWHQKRNGFSEWHQKKKNLFKMAPKHTKAFQNGIIASQNDMKIQRPSKMASKKKKIGFSKWHQ